MTFVTSMLLLAQVIAAPCAGEVVVRSAAVDSVIEVVGSGGVAPPGQATPFREQGPAVGPHGQRWLVVAAQRPHRTLYGRVRELRFAQDCAATDPAQRWKFVPVGAGGVMLTTWAAASGAMLAGSRSVPNTIYGLFEPDANDPIYRWVVTPA
jgi:hypothetical protein